MRFQRRGGRKGIVAPDGSAIGPSSKRQPGGTPVKALARAWRWQRMLDDGVYATVSDAERILKATSAGSSAGAASADIMETILPGKADQGMVLEQLERLLPVSWAEQRCLLMRQ
jgi:hypothetical protein